MNTLRHWIGSWFIRLGVWLTRPTRATWRENLRIVIEGRWRRGDYFNLPEVYAEAEGLARHYPANNHIHASVRRTLQELRDEGRLRFINDGGLYQRT